MAAEEPTTRRHSPIATSRAGVTPIQRLQHMFRALANRNYRLFWIGQLGHSASIWMEQIVRPLLVLELTGSAVMVGLVVACRTVPMLLFGFLAGAVADRYDRKRVLMITQVVILLTHLTLGILIVTHLIQLWQIFVTAAVAGAASAFNQPARQSLVPRLVERSELLNALALNQAAMNVTRIAGGGIGGLLLLVLDYGQLYLVNAVIYVGVILATSALVVRPDPADRRRRPTLGGDMVEGFRYVWQNRGVLKLIAMAMILFIFGLPYMHVFVPLLALEEFGIGRTGAGLMLAASGVGALAGSLLMAARTTVDNRQMTMMAMLSCFAAALIALAQSPNLVITALALVMAGAMSVSYMSLNSIELLERTTPAFHGRVLSLTSLDRGVIPIGAIMAGALAEAFGARVALTIMACACLALSGATLVALSRGRNGAT